MKANLTTNLIACAVIAGAFTAGFLTGPASADEQPRPDAQFQFHFDYDAAELGSLPRAEKLLARLKQDVRKFCGGNRKMSLNERSFVSTCIDTTMKDSINKFGSETVAQAYKTRAAG